MPNGWLSLSTDPFKSRRAQLSATCRHSWMDQTRNLELPGSRYRAPRNDSGNAYVSTNPLVDPLAAESLRPWGSAR